MTEEQAKNIVSAIESLIRKNIRDEDDEFTHREEKNNLKEALMDGANNDEDSGHS